MSSRAKRPGGARPAFGPLLSAQPNLLYNASRDFQRLDGSAGIDEQREPGRTAFHKDYARLLHAPSFRRLQGKTQLFPGVESDFFRNRLTHSLEVAQIATGIASKFNAIDLPGLGATQASIDLHLVEFASIAHDLGHPPFGHNGEAALDALMCQHGGFEGNAQTLRILTVVERKLVRTRSIDKGQDCFGLNLTMRALASVLKYDQPIPARRDESAKLAKGYYGSETDVVARIKRNVAPRYRGKFKTLECSIMDLADDIAYSTYDLEDSLHAGIITPLKLASSVVLNKSVRQTVFNRTNDALLAAGYEPLDEDREVVQAVEQLFNFHEPLPALTEDSPSESHALNQRLNAYWADQRLATDALTRSQYTAERVGDLIKAVELVPNAKYLQLSGVRLRRAEMISVEVLKHLNFELVIRSARLGTAEHRGQEIVTQIFIALKESDGALLPDHWRQRYETERNCGESQAMRVLCDYVAGMTDRFAADLHGKLFSGGRPVF